ncbi:unnamed protein product [Prorocentrum cordatum]|uniref:Uncharacterized protein n=1 Tax=Prorocentrum cordatum TaxID=2364126 RepID=A0ABN9SA94_9DINO|nr:unnamed protein product [Polarella glacialis]
MPWRCCKGCGMRSWSRKSSEEEEEEDIKDVAGTCEEDEPWQGAQRDWQGEAGARRSYANALRPARAREASSGSRSSQPPQTDDDNDQYDVAGACGEGERWLRALSLLSEIGGAKLEPDVIS